MACGTLSGFDSDRSYPLQLDGDDTKYTFRAPIQPPIRPNYYSYQVRMGVAAESNALVSQEEEVQTISANATRASFVSGDCR